MYFQQYGPVRFWVCFGFVLSAGAILKDFSALFLGLFGFVFSSRFFVFNNLSGSFFKITSFSVPFVPKSQQTSLSGQPPTCATGLRNQAAALAWLPWPNDESSAPRTVRSCHLHKPSILGQRCQANSRDWRRCLPCGGCALAKREALAGAYPNLHPGSRPHAFRPCRGSGEF